MGWPPSPAHTLNQKFDPVGIPKDSISSEIALAARQGLGRRSRAATTFSGLAPSIRNSIDQPPLPMLWNISIGFDALPPSSLTK